MITCPTASQSKVFKRPGWFGLSRTNKVAPTPRRWALGSAVEQQLQAMTVTGGFGLFLLILTAACCVGVRRPPVPARRTDAGCPGQRARAAAAA